MEPHISAIGDVDLPEAYAGARVHHLDLVRAVDHNVKFRSVYADVVADISEFLYDVRVALGVKIAGIQPGEVIEPVEGTLVRSHVPLVDQIEAPYPGVGRRMLGDNVILRRDHKFVLTTTCGDRQEWQKIKEKYFQRFHFRFQLLWLFDSFV